MGVKPRRSERFALKRAIPAAARLWMLLSRFTLTLAYAWITLNMGISDDYIKVSKRTGARVAITGPAAAS